MAVVFFQFSSNETHCKSFSIPINYFIANTPNTFERSIPILVD
jgi:hypothetical protein